MKSDGTTISTAMMAIVAHAEETHTAILIPNMLQLSLTPPQPFCDTTQDTLFLQLLHHDYLKTPTKTMSMLQ
jgi:hypothetical protein